MMRSKPLEVARASACRQVVVFAWFDAFEKFCKEHDMTTSDQVLICDEPGLPLQSSCIKSLR